MIRITSISLTHDWRWRFNERRQICTNSPNRLAHRSDDVEPLWRCAFINWFILLLDPSSALIQKIFCQKVTFIYRSELLLQDATPPAALALCSAVSRDSSDIINYGIIAAELFSELRQSWHVVAMAMTRVLLMYFPPIRNEFNRIEIKLAEIQAHIAAGLTAEIGRASCRERV